MTQNEIFDFLQQFDGLNKAELILQTAISTYNHNFYSVSKNMCNASFDFLFYGESDDEGYTEWFLCDKNQNIICSFGESYTMYPYEMITAYEDINYFHWYNLKAMENLK